MTALGDEIKDDELVNWLFISLPKSYEPLIMALQSATVDSGKLIFNFVSTRLIQEETRRKVKDHTDVQGATAANEVEMALSVTANKGSRNGGRNGGRNGKKPGECHYCSKKGH